MKKEFKHIPLEYIKNLGYWFWTREAFAFINFGITEAWRFYKDWRRGKYWSYIILIVFLYIVAIPFAYITVFTLGTYMRRHDTLRDVKLGAILTFHNKNNIAYFTILEMLRGESDGT